MNTFLPDLVVEVTKACNKACNGCYAPNILVPKNIDTEYLNTNYPGTFLSLTNLNDSLVQLDQSSLIIAVRGGEPSLHPKLGGILIMLSRKSRQVYLETHARWLLSKERSRYKELIQTISESKTIVKISFDSMHGMKVSELKEITTFLESVGIRYLVAITEETIEALLAAKASCDWISSDQIVFQFKGKTEQELIKPTVGVINVEGELKKSLTNKFENEIINILDMAL